MSDGDILKIPYEEQSRLARLIGEKATLPCPRCGKDDFGIAEVYTLLITSPYPDRGTLGNGHAAISSICLNCGFIALHSRPIVTGESMPFPRKPESDSEASDGQG